MRSSRKTKDEVELHESPYTIPNALTLVRIAACPYLAYSIVQGNYELATGILVASGLTDWVRLVEKMTDDSWTDTSRVNGIRNLSWDQSSILWLIKRS